MEHEDEPEDEDDHHNHSEGDVAGQEDQLPHTQNGTGESPISSGDDDEKDNTQIPPLSYSTNQLAFGCQVCRQIQILPHQQRILPPTDKRGIFSPQSSSITKRRSRTDFNSSRKQKEFQCLFQMIQKKTMPRQLYF